MEQHITNNNVRLSEEEVFAIKGDIAAGYYDGSAHERVVARVEHILAFRDQQVWDEAAEATAEWMANNPGPSGIPHDPPSNPYAGEGERRG